MRGARAKSIRRYVRGTFPMLPDQVLYKRKADGAIILLPHTKRAVYRSIKKNYKARARGEQLK